VKELLQPFSGGGGAVGGDGEVVIEDALVSVVEVDAFIAHVGVRVGFGLGLLVELAVAGGQKDRLSLGLVVVVGDGVLVFVDPPFLGGGGDDREGVHLLDLAENFGEVEGVVFSGGFDAEGHAGGFPADGELHVLGLVDVDGLDLRSLELSDLLLGGEGLGAEKGDLGIFLGLEGLQLEAHVALLDFAALTRSVDFELSADGESELDILFGTSGVDLSVEGCDETKDGFGLGGVHELDVSGGLGGLPFLGDFGLDLNLSLALGGDDGGLHELVDERKTGSGREGQSKTLPVVHLLEVEVLALAHLLEHVLKSWEQCGNVSFDATTATTC